MSQHHNQFLQLAVRAHQAGDFFQAKQFYQQQIQLNPRDFIAKQLLGGLYLSLNELPQAKVLLEESLKISPKQAQVRNNLGLCLEKMSDDNAAKKCYEKALKLQPDFIEPAKNLIKLFLRTGEFKLALDLALEKHSQTPDDIVFMRLLAKSAQNTGDYDLSLSTHVKILKQLPNDVSSRHNYAVVLRMAGRSKEALEIYLALLAEEVKNYQLFHNTANAHSDLGELENAVAMYQRAIELNPLYVDSHINLNDLLWELGNKDEFALSFKSALSQHTSFPLFYSYMDALIRAKRFDTLEAELIESHQEYRNCADFYYCQAKIAEHFGRFESAIEFLRQAAEQKGANSKHFIELAVQLIEQNMPGEAIKYLNKVLSVDPYEQLALAYLGVAWRMLGDPKEKKLNDYQNMVREYHIEGIEGFSSIEEFCVQLETYLTDLHVSEHHPLKQTVREGTQTMGNLFTDDNPLIQSVLLKIKECVEDYGRKVGVRSTSGKLTPVTEFEFTGSWSIRMNKNGFHTMHVHPKGWLSSCFYVQLPSQVETSEKREGWIKFGEPNLTRAGVLAAEKYVKPAIGKLVLFPSYMWHGTIPFDSDEHRTTIAFDVTAKKKGK